MSSITESRALIVLGIIFCVGGNYNLKSLDFNRCSTEFKGPLLIFMRKFSISIFVLLFVLSFAPFHSKSNHF